MVEVVVVEVDGDAAFDDEDESADVVDEVVVDDDVEPESLELLEDPPRLSVL